MFASPQSIQNQDTIEVDVCIAGAGAAGITLALELEGSGLKVCLLEGGGFEPPELSTSHPYAGKNAGEPYELLTTRLRYFGGTTNHWGGWCRPLDEIDFRPRPFVPLSGWPIQRAELDPYYIRASKVCEIDPPGYELDELPGQSRPQEEFFHYYDSEFVTKAFRFSPPTRFGTRYRDNIRLSRSVTTFLDSTVVEIEKPGRQVARLRVRSGEKTFFVKARLYIIALGGIENARLLLHSDRHDPQGVGNESDYVGRCFADHLGKTVGTILTSLKSPYIQYVRGGARIMPHLSFRNEYLVKHELVNFGIVFLESSQDYPLGPDYFADARLYSGWEGSREPKLFYVVVRFESTPNPDSRVTLIGERDRNGMRRVLLDWRRNQIEFLTLERVSELLARKVGHRNLGRFRRTFRPERDRRFTYQAHQVGTTRMSSEPSFGVVNTDCRVHSAENLYVAGSSVFPTFGFANPTLTIVALAIRLADHLKQMLGGGK